MDKQELSRTDSGDQRGITLRKNSTKSHCELLVTNKYLLTSKHVSELTIEKSLLAPQVSVVKLDMGEVFLTQLLLKTMNEICVLSGSDMTGDAKGMIVQTIINDFWYLKIDEVLLVMTNGIKKKYGELYGQLTYPTIYGWFSKHEQDRNKIFEEKHEQKKSETDNTMRSPEPRLTKNFLQEWIDDKVEKRIDAYKKKVNENNL